MNKTKQFEIIWREPNTLTPYVKNAKIHSTEQIDKIAQQIASFGFDQPIVIDQKGVIIKGHGRREAALRLNLDRVPVIITDLDEYQAMAARIADNKVAEAPWDNELLKFDINSLDLKNFDLDLTGLDNVSINNFLNPEEIERETGKGIEDFQEIHENTDIRQIILIMSQDDFEPIIEKFLTIQKNENLDNNTEVVKYLLSLYGKFDS